MSFKNGELTRYKSDFLVIAAGSPVPPIAASFKSFAISDWTVLASDELPVSQVLDARGHPVGFLLGFWLSKAGEGQLSSHTLTLPLDTNLSGVEGLAEWVLTNCLGRYAFVLVREGAAPRFYPDASGSLSAVYQFSTRMIASRPELCALTSTNVAEEALVDQLREIRRWSGTWYPAGYCNGSDIRVVLPNHYFDLGDWRLKRFWSYTSVSIDQKLQSIERGIANITHDIERVIDTVGRSHALTLSLTSGRDSRMVLACCPKPLLKHIVFHTLPHHSEADVQVARLLSDHFSLSLDVQDTPPRDRVLVQGVGGEVGRCFYWKEADFDYVDRTVDTLADRLGWGTVSHPFVRDALTDWMSELDGVSWLRMLDLAYIELRVACAHAPAMYDHDQTTVFALYPMNGRSLFSAMLSLPERWRYDHGLFLSVIKLKWPELILFPLHKAHWTGWGRYQALLSYVRYRNRWSTSQRVAFMKVATAGNSIPRMISLDFMKFADRMRRMRFSRRS